MLTHLAHNHLWVSQINERLIPGSNNIFHVLSESKNLATPLRAWQRTALSPDTAPVLNDGEYLSRLSLVAAFRDSASAQCGLRTKIGEERVRCRFTTPTIAEAQWLCR